MSSGEHSTVIRIGASEASGDRPQVCKEVCN